eukprot:1012314-Rhodomonas_salina.1
MPCARSRPFRAELRARTEGSRRAASASVDAPPCCTRCLRPVLPPYPASSPARRLHSVGTHARHNCQVCRLRDSGGLHVVRAWVKERDFCENKADAHPEPARHHQWSRCDSVMMT